MFSMQKSPPPPPPPPGAPASHATAAPHAARAPRKLGFLVHAHDLICILSKPAQAKGGDHTFAAVLEKLANLRQHEHGLYSKVPQDPRSWGHAVRMRPHWTQCTTSAHRLSRLPAGGPGAFKFACFSAPCKSGKSEAPLDRALRNSGRKSSSFSESSRELVPHI
jgi:hypothetical protein